MKNNGKQTLSNRHQTALRYAGKMPQSQSEANKALRCPSMAELDRDPDGELIFESYGLD